MPFKDAPKNYWKVQSAIGTLGVNERINSREISEMVDAISVDVTNYTKAMNCVRRVGEESVPGSGPKAVVYERIDFAGSICIDCQSSANCILKFIAENIDNLDRLPPVIAQKQQYVNI